MAKLNIFDERNLNLKIFFDDFKHNKDYELIIYDVGHPQEKSIGNTIYLNYQCIPLHTYEEFEVIEKEMVLISLPYKAFFLALRKKLISHKIRLYDLQNKTNNIKIKMVRENKNTVIIKELEFIE